ncbi:MAG TPA: sigma-54-dependent Fis family transcriptional regulator [Desulfotomaculum sp.]|nr:sigma-54-dependent Fis family transcriptional regulator [Desulfotomaculum sp.]
MNVLVVDDEIQIHSMFKRALDKQTYMVTTVCDIRAACIKLAERKYNVALIDLNLPDGTGLDLLQNVRAAQPQCNCIIMTGYGSTKTAVQAIKLGAYDYIEKPFVPLNELKRMIDGAVSGSAAVVQGYEWQLIERCASQVGLVIGNNEAMKQLIKTAYKIAGKKVNVLITGETGTGKEVMARFIHAASERRNNIFFPVNCGAIHESLLESELFGHEKGSFTGAVTTRKGVFELADNGTLFLDELAEASQAIQIKLLRILETGEFVRLGGQKTITTDTRVIAATNAKIEDAVKSNQLREDLFYRLDVVRLELPALKDRVSDIPELADYFINKLARQQSLINSPALTEEALSALKNYHWNGNIRELYNVIQQLMINELKGHITINDLPSKIWNKDNNPYNSGSVSNMSIKDYLPMEITSLLNALNDKLNALGPATDSVPFSPRHLCEVEKEYIEKTIEFFNGNLTLAARALGLSRATLYRKVKQNRFRN